MNDNKCFAFLSAAVLLSAFASVDAVHVTYPGIGTFHIGEFYDFFNRPFVDLKLPDTPESLMPSFFLYTRNNPDQNVSLRWNNSHDILNAQYFDDQLPVKMLIHGYINSESETSQDDVSWMIPLKNAMLAYEDMNVIIVVWPNRWPYEKSTVNTRVVGPMVAIQIQTIVNNTNATLDQFHLVGHSLGAHISGYAGKFLKGQLGWITGLDVARLNFENIRTEGRLWHTDAKFVEAIHTDATTTGFGIIGACGHVDIYPNGGAANPGCEVNSFSTFVGAVSKLVTRCVRCDHHRANDYYIEAWEKGNSPEMVTAVECSSYSDFKEKLCMNCGERKEKCVVMGPRSIELMARVANLEPGKQFFISTASTKPYFRQPCITA